MKKETTADTPIEGNEVLDIGASIRYTETTNIEINVSEQDITVLALSRLLAEDLPNERKDEIRKVMRKIIGE